MSQASPTFKKHLQTHAAKGLRLLASVFVGVILVHWFTGSHSDIIIDANRGDSQQVMQTREHAPGSPTGVLAQHKDECWHGSQAPKADLPGAAIVQFQDGTTIYTREHVHVDAAFNEALAIAGFSGKISDKIDVIALCK